MRGRAAVEEVHRTLPEVSERRAYRVLGPPRAEQRYTVRVLIERWREHYNRVRPHSALGYRQPAPDAIAAGPPSASL